MVYLWTLDLEMVRVRAMAGITELFLRTLRSHGASLHQDV